ncbi:MAG: VCBS repeat-containing protein [Pyrinomonadaceae bacterium]|nr:VCBS repeat-containing protein [Pyrinomonadaceae bacterium]
MAAADFNRDGLMDIASISINGVGIFLNSASGFGSPTYFAAETAIESIAATDFNRDGAPDLAVVNRVAGQISILLGNGQGNFSAAQSYAVGGNPFNFTFADFNADGNIDIAVPLYTRATVATLDIIGNKIVLQD